MRDHPPEKPLGQIAYEAYGHDRAWVRAAGDPMCSWEELGSEFKRAWAHAALTAVNYELKRGR